jgi:hypothetical protein
MRIVVTTIIAGSGVRAAMTKREGRLPLPFRG